MRENGASTLTRYAVAVASVVAATLLRAGLDPILGVRFPFATVFFAVLFSAWFGGLGPALLASVLGSIGSALFLLPPHYTLRIEAPEDRLGLMLYGAVSIGIALIGGAMHAARRRSEASAVEAGTKREQLRVTLESIGDAVITTDTRGNVTSMNSVASALTGWSAGEAVGRPLGEVFRIADERSGRAVPDPVQTVLQRGVVVGLANHTVLVARDGSVRPIDDSAAPIRDEKGQVIGVVLVFRDVAEKKQAEERLRRSEQELSDFFENANVGLHFVAPDGIVLRANQAELDMLGYRRDEYVGHHISEFHVDREVIEDILRRLAAGETIQGRSAQMRCKDGSIKDVVINSSVLWEDGRFVHTRCFTLDVTTRRRAEEAQALLAAVVASSEDAIITKTLDGIITSWNAGAERVFGYAAAEAIGRPITLVVPADRRDEERRILESLRVGVRIETFETIRVAKDGKRLDISLTVSPVRDANGRIIGASKVARDVTGRKRTEQALREGEERFRALAMNSPAAIFIKDLEGRYTLANPLACEALGRPDAAVGLTDHDLLPQPIADELRRRDLEVIASGRPVESEEVVSRPGYERRFLSVKFPLFGAEGPVGVCGVAIDITDRKHAEEALRESEERFRTMADNIAQFAWMADRTGWIFWYNRRWFDYTGTTMPEMEGWGWRKVHHPDHVDRVVDKITRCFQTGRVWEDTFPLRAADGTYRWFLSRAIPIRDETGQVLRWFGTNTDITAQREAEQALRVADQRKDAFLAILAHELRNPLAPIRNSLEITKRANGDPRLLAESHTMMERQLSHLERLVDDLVDIARISHDQLELRRERVELSAIVQQAVETCRPLAEASRIELNVVTAPEPIHLDADAVRLSQVFSNLLNNACKYTPRGGRVWITTRRDGGQVVVSVRDTGVGIPVGMLSDVFDMFTQLGQVTEKTKEGLGVGLTLVRRLVELHGGKVEARSEGAGRGSEFVVRLPLQEGASEPPSPAPAPAAWVRRRILIVDDNVDAAESLSTLLRFDGHETRVAHEGAGALEAAEAFRPDVVLLDIGLPKMDGYDVAREIRARGWGGEVTLVALTGWGQDDDRRKSAETGFDHHMVKPVDLAVLKQLLARAVDPAGGAAESPRDPGGAD